MRTITYPRAVYKIILDEKVIYVGSTSLFYNKATGYNENKIEYRLAVHKHSKCHPILRERRDDLKIELIEYINCKEELGKENEWIEYYREKEGTLLNERRPLFRDGYNTKDNTIYYREYRNNNREYIREYNREYYRIYRKVKQDKIKEINKRCYEKKMAARKELV